MRTLHIIPELLYAHDGLVGDYFLSRLKSLVQ